MPNKQADKLVVQDLDSSTTDSDTKLHPDTNAQAELYDDEKRRNYPREYFHAKEEWTQDKSDMYFKGFRENVGWPLLKGLTVFTLVMTLQMYEVGWPYVILACCLALMCYQYVIASMNGLVVMPPMD